MITLEAELTGGRRARKGRGKTTLGATAVASLIVLSVILSSVPSAAAASNSSFIILGSSWSSSSGEAGPGSTNVPLTIDVEYVGGVTANYLVATLYLPTGFTTATGNTTAVNGAASVSYSIFHLKYNITIASSVSVGTYLMPIEFSWTTGASGRLIDYGESSTVAVSLLGTVVLKLQPSQTTLKAGAVNSITFTLTNSGSGTATQIKPSVSTTAGSVLTALPVIPSLGAGASTQFVVDVFVPASTATQSIITSTAGSAVILTFTTAYNDAYGNSETAAQAVGFQAVSAAEPILSFTSSSGSLIPGQANGVQIEVTNLGPGNVTRVYTSITASAGFSVLNQIPMISVLQANVPMNATIRVFAPTSAAGTAAILTFAYSYVDPYGISASGSQTLGFYTASSSTVTSANTLTVVALNTSLIAGDESPVSFLITNTGQQPVYSPTISLATSTPLVVSTNSTLSLTGVVIQPGRSLVYNAVVTSSIGSAASGTKSTGGFYAGTVTIAYTDEFGDAHSQVVPVALSLAVPIASLSVNSVSTEVILGGTSVVSLLVSNTGTATIYSPTFSMSAPSGLAVTTNSTYAPVGLVIKPGQSIRYDADVTDGPKTTEGAYAGTLTVTYTDQFGNSYSQSFSPGLVVVGQIQMQIQGESVTSANGTVTVSGTLLNEGQGSAYYLQVTASLPTSSSSPASSTEYVGEVDPNTPVPFSLTFAIRAPATSSHANLTLIADYKNDYSQNFQYKYSAPVTLSSSGSVSLVSGQSSSLSTGTLNLFRYVLLAVVVIALASAALYVRRSRSRKASRTKSDVI